MRIDTLKCLRKELENDAKITSKILFLNDSSKRAIFQQLMNNATSRILHDGLQFRDAIEDDIKKHSNDHNTQAKSIDELINTEMKIRRILRR